VSTQDDAAPATRSASLGWVWRVALTNLPFLIVLAFGSQLPDFLLALAVGAVMFLAPGLAWSDRRRGDAFVVLFHAVLASLAIGLVVWLLLLALPGPTSRIGFIAGVALLANVGLWLGLRRGWYTANPFGQPMARLLLATGAAVYLLSYAGAAWFVPALEDQDMETQGTAYGLIHELEPTMPINRPHEVGGRYFFAHPLLLHFWIGESALVSDDLDRLRHYHEGSLRARDGASAFAEWETAFDQFMVDPVLLPTRTPNLFLAVFLVFGAGFLVFRMTGSRAAAVGACVIYATLPEVYVRTSYGGYMALTNFLLVSGAYFYIEACGFFPDQKAAAPAARRSGGLAAFLAGWADQKGILMAFAAPAHAVVRLVSDRSFLNQSFGLIRRGQVVDLVRSAFARPDFAAAFVIGLSFIVGWGTFALYGLAVDSEAFIADHIVGHVAERLTLTRIEFLGSDFNYPSVQGLWMEFFDHSGWPLIPVALVAGFYAAGRIREAHGVLLIWALIGAIGFSFVDWRQTKHFAHILPAVAMMAGIWWASLQGRMRMAATAAIAAGLLWNIWRIGLLMQDFETIQPTPIW
jgi:hypothetical protein